MTHGLKLHKEHKRDLCSALCLCECSLNGRTCVSMRGYEWVRACVCVCRCTSVVWIPVVCTSFIPERPPILNLMGRYFKDKKMHFFRDVCVDAGWRHTHKHTVWWAALSKTHSVRPALCCPLSTWTYGFIIFFTAAMVRMKSMHIAISFTRRRCHTSGICLPHTDPRERGVDCVFDLTDTHQ